MAAAPAVTSFFDNTPSAGKQGTKSPRTCALGGWEDHNTILKCYEQPDPEAMLALENRGTLRLVDGS